MGEQKNFTNAKIAVIVHMQINAKKGAGNKTIRMNEELTHIHKEVP